MKTPPFLLLSLSLFACEELAPSNPLVTTTDAAAEDDTATPPSSTVHLDGFTPDQCYDATEDVSCNAGDGSQAPTEPYPDTVIVCCTEKTDMVEEFCYIGFVSNPEPVMCESDECEQEIADMRYAYCYPPTF